MGDRWCLLSASQTPASDLASEIAQADVVVVAAAVAARLSSGGVSFVAGAAVEATAVPASDEEVAVSFVAPVVVGHALLSAVAVDLQMLSVRALPVGSVSVAAQGSADTTAVAA